jgi:ABC-2 type transport system permease protein
MSELVLPQSAEAAKGASRFRVARIVAAKEWLELTRDSRLRWLCALVVLLMLAALGFGAAERERIASERAAASRADRALWTGQGAKDPHAAAHFGQYAFKPESPLALADPGVDAYVGSAVWLEAHKQNDAKFRSARDGGVAARLGGLSLAYILQTIAPLVVILMGFSSFSGERESGTLKQLLGVGADPRDLLAGKALALTGAIFALLAPAFIGAALALALLTDREHFSLGDQFLRLCVLGLVYCAYLAGFALLTLGVSAIAKNSRAALVALLGFWLANCFLAPRVMTDAAKSLAPTPTAQEFRSAVAKDRAHSFGHDERHPAFVAFRDEVLRQYGVARVKDLPVNFRGLALRKDDENGYAIFDRHYAALQSAFDRQDKIRAAAGFLFPLLALRPLSMSFAGVDSRAQNDFATAAEAHRREIQNEVSDNLIHFGRYGDSSYVAGPELWERIGSFSYRAPGAQSALSHSAGELAGLGVWLALTAAFAVFSVRRLRPL